MGTKTNVLLHGYCGGKGSDYPCKYCGIESVLTFSSTASPVPLSSERSILIGRQNKLKGQLNSSGEKAAYQAGPLGSLFFTPMLR
jgi:hypothetical protein